MLLNIITLAEGNASEKIVGALQAYIGPVLLFIIGIVAITFLFQRQIMQFVIFLVIAILVAILFYAPGIIKSIAKAFAGETSVEQGSTGW